MGGGRACLRLADRGHWQGRARQGWALSGWRGGSKGTRRVAIRPLANPPKLVYKDGLMSEGAQDVVETVGDVAIASPVTDDLSLCAWAVRLDAMPELAGEIGERIANRERLWDIARGLGVKRRQLMRWLNAVPSRKAEYEAGLEAMADELVMDTLDEARDAGVEDVSVRKFRSDLYLKLAGKFDAPRWGDKQVSGGGGITVVIQRGGTEPPSVDSTGKILTLGA